MYSAIVEKPIGYISKIGLEGTRSETGPNMIDVSRKSYTLGACRSTRSGRGKAALLLVVAVGGSARLAGCFEVESIAHETDGSEALRQSLEQEMAVAAPTIPE